MRDWTLVVAPVAAAIYVLLEPDQFFALMRLLERYVN
jgi:hypothetical protein